MLKQPIRTVLDLLKPNIEKNVLNKQATQKENHDPTSRSRCFCVDQPVMVRSYCNSDPKWIPGIILKKKGNLTYLVKLQDGIVWKRHSDQLQEFNGTQDTDNWIYPGDNHLDSNVTNSNSNSMEQSSNHRYPQRDRHPPSRFDPTIGY